MNDPVAVIHIAWHSIAAHWGPVPGSQSLFGFIKEIHFSLWLSFLHQNAFLQYGNCNWKLEAETGIILSTTLCPRINPASKIWNE